MSRGWELNSEQVRYYCDAALVAGVELHDEVGSNLVIISDSDRILEQLVVTGITATVGASNIYAGDERVGATVRRAYEDAVRWVSER